MQRWQSGGRIGVLINSAGHGPLKRYGTSEDIAATVSFLVSEGAAYIIGENTKMTAG